MSPEDSLLFDYGVEIHKAGKPNATKIGNVILADDFVAVSDKSSALLDDYTLCRVFSWSPGKAMENQSCYWAPAFRQRELATRRGLRAVLEKAFSVSKTGKISPNLQNSYWAEQELAAQDVASDPLVRSKGADTIDWSLGGVVVVRTSVAGLKFLPSDRLRVARYLARHVDLHPQVRHAILDAGEIPARIEIVRLFGMEESREILIFSNFHRSRAVYPLPPGLESAVQFQALQSTIEGLGLKRALQVIANKTSDVPPTLDELMGNLKAASAKQSLGAMLIFLEIAQQYGAELMSDPASMAKFDAMKPDIQAAMSDPLARELMAANDASGNAKPGPARVLAARYWANGKTLDTLPFGTFRFVSYANLVRGSGNASEWDPSIAKSMPAITDCYWKHIAAYPWAGNAFKDLGDSYLQDFDAQNAWLAWDLGRIIDRGPHPSLLSQVDQYELYLRRVMPDSF